MILGNDQLLQILVVGPLAYILVVVVMRTSGKRTLSKMNQFDFIVTIALGSVLATIILDDSISLLEGVSAFAVLIVAQFIITFASSRSERVKKIVKARPALVYSRDGFHSDAMKRERVTREEVEAAARSSGYASLDAVDAVVLETDGSFSVMTSDRR